MLRRQKNKEPKNVLNNLMQHDVRGSLWNRWDLHFHTPSSFDYENGNVTNEMIVDALAEKGVKVVAITDHHQIDVARIRDLQRLAQNKLTVLPGIELRDDHGGTPIHYICIFPEDCDLDHIWTTLQGALGLTAAAIREKGGDDRVYVPIEKGAFNALAGSLGILLFSCLGGPMWLLHKPREKWEN